ncbi:MAG: COX15/CtaA family protein [Paraglaciecola sp.]|uniref:COX15/CtaA family protein n=1 Tax=Pseudomonadati TaxID=3379134 RepID=UPI00273E61F4|nr:COX15/CtaA family protein [Paraglaciecola sp.]MDP5029851.1 COX15/CtaA family protein [Paraglaciecola sp.]MDP5041456.1 COX15/CtaA family protein [Paraglaciecola sp.]MDP5130971.1 COX15/CtaA family protein [Paraglaciecola sp.]
MKKLVFISILLAAVVIILGAYARLTDAGLGCPDWPGCYGHLSLANTSKHIETAQQHFPDRPYEAHKARNEMVHRYFASGLGFVILVIFIISVWQRRHGVPLKLPFFLLCLVCFQGALGMWTVTLNLLPVVVMGHLLGGFSVLSCLFLLYLRLTPYRIPGGDHRMRSFGKFTLFAIFVATCQIALGGWTSANYAALACTELPLCEGDWYARLDFAGAFSVPHADNYEYGVHDYDERMTMHIMHRLGAIITFIYLSWMALGLYKAATANLIKRLCILLMLILGVQVILGVSNVVFSLPIAVAVMHNFVAACLLLVLVTLSYTLYRKT